MYVDVACPYYVIERHAWLGIRHGVSIINRPGHTYSSILRVHVYAQSSRVQATYSTVGHWINISHT